VKDWSCFSRFPTVYPLLIQAPSPGPSLPYCDFPPLFDLIPEDRLPLRREVVEVVLFLHDSSFRRWAIRLVLSLSTSPDSTPTHIRPGSPLPVSREDVLTSEGFPGKVPEADASPTPCRCFLVSLVVRAPASFTLFSRTYTVAHPDLFYLSENSAPRWAVAVYGAATGDILDDAPSFSFMSFLYSVTL